jgi:ABC-type lipoprotein export system ATPase subunit
MEFSDMVQDPLTVELDRAGKQYLSDGASVTALLDVSLQFRAGEFVALTGRSGCGKTTLLNLCGAMDFPTSGRVVVNGFDTLTLDDRGLTSLRRTSIGFVFQFFQLLPALTAVENVELPLLLAGSKKARERAIEILHWVEMDAYSHRLPHQLSGGQMQRMAVARALVHSPSVVLADEPIGNLDTSAGEVVLRLLELAARERGAAVIMATHSLESAERCDTVVKLRDGRVENVTRRT